MSRNVLIAPLLGTRGEEEWERLERTIEECEAMKVFVLTLPPDKDRFSTARELARDRLQALTRRWARFRWEERQLNLFDFDECLRVFGGIIAGERGSDITISVGTAGAVGASAGAVACMLWRARGVYVASPGYETQPITYIPQWLSAGPPVSSEGLRILKLLAESQDGLDKKTLVEKLKESGRIPPDIDKHAYRRLSSALLPPLLQHGFVVVGPRDDWDRRHHFVRLTVEGRRVLAILEPTLREPAAVLHVRGSRGRRTMADKED